MIGKSLSNSFDRGSSKRPSAEQQEKEGTKLKRLLKRLLHSRRETVVFKTASIFFLHDRGTTTVIDERRTIGFLQLYTYESQLRRRSSQ